MWLSRSPASSEQSAAEWMFLQTEDMLTGLMSYWHLCRTCQITHVLTLDMKSDEFHVEAFSNSLWGLNWVFLMSSQENVQPGLWRQKSAVFNETWGNFPALFVTTNVNNVTRSCNIFQMCLWRPNWCFWCDVRICCQHEQGWKRLLSVSVPEPYRIILKWPHRSMTKCFLSVCCWGLSSQSDPGPASASVINPPLLLPPP